MMLVDKPWPVTTSAPGPSSDERRQRTRTCPWASSPALTALISYSVSVGCQPRTGCSASSTARKRALTGPFPVASAPRSSPPTLTLTEPVASLPGTRRFPAVGRGHAPADEGDRCRHLGGALLDDGMEIRVGDLLLGIRQR